MTPIEQLMNTVKWVEVETANADSRDELPYVTHEGTLVIFNAPLKVFQLSDGQRVIDADDMEKFFSGEQNPR